MAAEMPQSSAWPFPFIQDAVQGVLKKQTTGTSLWHFILILLKRWVIEVPSPVTNICDTIHSEKEPREESSLAAIGFDGLCSGGGSARRLGTPRTWHLCSSWTVLIDAFFISRRRNSSVSDWTSGPTRTSWTRGRWHVSVAGL